MGQAGTEYSRRAQCDDRQYHAQEGRAQRNGGPAGSALQGVADADDRRWWRAQGDHVPHHRRWSGRPGPLVHPPGARRPQGRPDAEREDDRHGGQRSEQEHERVECDAGGVLGQSCLAERCDGGQRRGDHDRAHSAGQAHQQVPCHVDFKELPAGHAHSDQRGMVLALHIALAGQRLAHDRQPDERRERRQDPPPDGLRVDGRLDRGGRSVLARGADTACPQVQSVGLFVEPGDAGRTVAKADVVLVLHRCVREHRTREPGAGIEEVGGGGPGRELDLAGLDPDHLQSEVRTVGDRELRVGVVVVGGLGGCFERDVDHGSDVHPVLLQRGRCQHLVGFRRIGQPAGDEREGRRAPVRRDRHAEVVVVDRSAVTGRIPSVGEDELRGRGHPTHVGDRRHRPGGVDDAVEPVGRHEARERVFCPPARGRRS